MRRHDLDWISLIAGIVFTLIAITYLVMGVTDLTIDARVVWPLVFVALGAAGIATAVSATTREERAFTPRTEDPPSTDSSG